MKYCIRRFWLVIAAAIVAGLETSALAIPTLFLSDGVGDTVTVADGSGLDSNPNAGAVGWSGSLGKWKINVGTSIESVTGIPPGFDLSSLYVSSSGRGALHVWFSDNNLDPATVLALEKLSGKTHGSVSYKTFADEDNALFGTAMPLKSQALHGKQLSKLEEASGPYSFSEEVTFKTGGNKLKRFSANLIGAETGGSTTPTTGGSTSYAAPEGGTAFILFGIGLMALWLFGRWQDSHGDATRFRNQSHSLSRP